MCLSLLLLCKSIVGTVTSEEQQSWHATFNDIICRFQQIVSFPFEKTVAIQRDNASIMLLAMLNIYDSVTFFCICC